MNRLVKTLGIIAGIALLVGCFPPRPQQATNICDVFQQYPAWYWDAKATEQKWGVPVPVQMAIMYAESGFEATAEPPPERHLGKVIPWHRESTALGYCQALNQTWSCYESETKKYESRDQFAAASDFIGWYASQAKQISHIDPTDAYHLYLAYHEGLGGYHAGSYWHKPWLIHFAKRVQTLSETYAEQLKACEGSIPKPTIVQ